MRIKSVTKYFNYKNGDIDIHEMAPHMELHSVVLSVKQRNIDLLPTLISNVSFPNYQRPFYSRDEVGNLTSNPELTELITFFLLENGVNQENVYVSAYGEYITVNATVSTLSNLLKAEFYYFHSKKLGIKFIRALSYTLPAFIAESLSAIFNVIHMPINYFSNGRPVMKPFEYLNHDEENFQQLWSTKSVDNFLRVNKLGSSSQVLFFLSFSPYKSTPLTVFTS